MDLFRVIGEERNANRAVPVLFARRNIAIGEELTFNYNLKYEEEVDDDTEIAEIENVTSEKVYILKELDVFAVSNDNSKIYFSESLYVNVLLVRSVKTIRGNLVKKKNGSLRKIRNV